MIDKLIEDAARAILKARTQRSFETVKGERIPSTTDAAYEDARIALSVIAPAVRETCAAENTKKDAALRKAVEIFDWIIGMSPDKPVRNMAQSAVEQIAALLLDGLAGSNAMETGHD